MMLQSGITGTELIANIDNIFFSGESAWLNNLTDSNIESLFSSTLKLENQVKIILEKVPEMQDDLNKQLQWRFGKRHFKITYTVSDFEKACDRLLTMFFTNSKKINVRALSKAILTYMNILPAARFEKVYNKLLAQCAMSNAVLSIMADCGSDNAEADLYNIKIFKELPMLVDHGRCGFPAATTLIQEMMVANEISLETLIKALISYEDESILQLFVQGTIVKTLERVDNNYATFWKLLVNIKDQTLVPKLADRYPDFLSSLETFIVCCGDAMKVLISVDFELQWDFKEALLTHDELMALIKCVVTSGGISSTSIKKTITKRQQRAMDEAESDHSSVWIELGKECFN